MIVKNLMVVVKNSSLGAIVFSLEAWLMKLSCVIYVDIYLFGNVCGSIEMAAR